MIERINIFGYWYLPSRANEKKPGILRFTPSSNIELEIYGMFGDLLLGPDIYPLILGETNEGLVSLVDVLYTKRNDKHSKYQCMYLIKGMHFDDINQIKFEGCIFDLFGLEFFFKKSSFDFNEVDSVRKWEIKYQAQDKIPFEITNSLKGSINFEGLPSFTYPSKINIKENAYVKFEYNSETPLENILLDLGKFRGFISLLNDETSFPRKILLKENSGGKNLELIYKNIFYQDKTKEWFKPIVSFHEIEDFQELISNWYKEYTEIEHVFNLRLYHYRDKNFFSTDRFIDMTRALESFHRLRRKNERIDPDEYNEFRKKVKKIDLDRKLKRLLNDRLNYGNEPTFKMRLEEIFSELPESTIQVIDEDGKLAKVVKDTRNYYTHYGDELKDKIPSTRELIAITDNLESMISYILLKEMGVDDELLANSFNGKGLFKKWRHST